MSETKAVWYTGWRGDNPEGRVFALTFYQEHYYVGQWDHILQKWILIERALMTVDPLQEKIWWRPFPQPPYQYKVHPKVYAVEE